MKTANLTAMLSAATLAFLHAASATAQTSDKWIIAEVAPLSGPAATVGAQLNKVARLWAEEANARGGIKGKKIELVTCNDEAKPEKAVACVRDALRQGAVIFLGHSLTASTRAMQSALANGPLMIVASPNIVPSSDTFTFQVSPSDHHITLAVADYVEANKLKGLGMVAATDASGEVGVQSAQKVFADRKLDLKLRRIDLKANDSSVQLASVAGPDVSLVYSSYSGGGAATVVKSFTNLGLTQPLVVSYANLSAAFIEVVKDVMPKRLLGTAIKSLVPDTMGDAATAKRAKEFMAAYEKKYGERSDMINLLGKMDVDVAEAVLTNVANPTDNQAVKKFLESTPIESVQHLKFSPDSHVGLTEKDVVIVEYKNGGWVSAAPVGAR